ncbi:response regulator transcription factor [Kribbella hippodromi]|uniref:Response regulator transcription factor n=1 Tax=Kribbella hippodromi TaxID=434347 RepID=A0ABN2DDV8_9ACTN
MDPVVDAVGTETRVVLVDDDALVRMGLQAMLDGVSGIQVVGEAADGSEVPAAVAAHRPDVVLMDLRMKRIDGITATRELRARGETPAVIVLTTFNDDDLIEQSIRAGAVGYLLKHAPPDDIVRAIRAAHAGESLLSPEIARRVLTLIAGTAEATGTADAIATARARLRHLSTRELQVAKAVADGKSNAEIATALAITVPTVKGYVGTIFTKTDAENRVQLALIVNAAGL